MRYYSKIKNHWLAIVLALAVGFLILFPNIYVISKIGIKDFKGIYPIFNNDEIHYLGKAKEVSDGHGKLGNTFLKEHKDEIGVRPGFGAKIIVAESRLLNLSIPAVSAINDFIFPFISFILIYSIFFLAIKNKNKAILFSIFYFFIFLNLFSRPINPQLSIVFFFLIILLFLIYFYKYKNKYLLFNIFFGIVFSFLVRLYPYYWTAFFLFYFIFSFLSAIYEKKYIFYLRNFLIFSVSGIVLSFDYFYNSYLASLSENYHETALRLGVVETHWPACYFNVGLLFLSLIALVLIFNKIKNKKEFLLYISFPIAGIIVNWQNLITGKYLQFSSHYRMVTVLFVLITIGYVFSKIKIKFKKIDFLTIFSFLMIMAVFGSISAKYYKSAYDYLTISENGIKYYEEIQSLAGVADWFNRNSEFDSSIYALGSNNYSWLVPMYTHNNIFSNIYISYYLMPNKELEDRWVIHNIFNDDINYDYILKSNRGIWGNRFIDEYQNKEVRRKIKEFITGRKYDENVYVPDEYITRVLNKYNDYRDLELKELFSLYSIDYILLDKNSLDMEVLEKFDTEEYFELLMEIDGNKIYKFIK